MSNQQSPAVAISDCGIFLLGFRPKYQIYSITDHKFNWFDTL